MDTLNCTDLRFYRASGLVLKGALIAAFLSRTLGVSSHHHVLSVGREFKMAGDYLFGAK